MSIITRMKERLAREEERLEALTASLPGLQERLAIAERHAEATEADILTREATEGILNDPAGPTEESLRHAKLAVYQRRREVEQTERGIRLADALAGRMREVIEQAERMDLDGRLAKLDDRIPKVAKRMAEAWIAFEKAASEADDLKREQQTLKKLVPIRGMPVSVTNRIPRFPALEDLRHKGPGKSMAHPAAILRSHGYDDLADRITNAA